jgi:di/tricarboxylate transporter
MTVEIASVLGVIVVAMSLLALDLLRVDLVAAGVLLFLALGGFVTTKQAFSAFSGSAIITVGSMFVISEGVLRAGVASRVGRTILKVTSSSEARLIVALMLTGGLMSAFMNNVGAVAMLLPAVIGIARETNISPSKLCIPLGFGSLLGGVCTLVGTPANLLVSDALGSRGLAPLGIFDFTPVGLILLVVGIGYMAVLGRHLLPERPLDPRLRAIPSVRRTAREYYRLEDRLFVVRILPHSALVGMTLLDSQLGKTLGVNVLSIVRKDRNSPAPTKEEMLLADDLLLVEGRPEEIYGAEQQVGLALETEVGCEIQDLQSDDIGVAEMVLAPHSSLTGRTLEDIHFRDRFGLTVLAVWRDGRPRRSDLARLPLRFGDAFLVQGPWEKIRLLGSEPDFLLLESSEERARPHKMRWAVGVLALVVVSQITGLLPIALATFLGAALIIAVGGLSVDEAYAAIDWKIIFLIGGMLPLGLALEETGAALYLVDLIIAMMGGTGAYLIQAGILVLTVLLTQVLPSPAIAVLMAPVGLDTAARVGADPRALLLGIAMAASASFLTPVGHQVSVLVMGPGSYKFTDYTRAGLLLNLLVLLIILVALPVFWASGSM